MEITKELLERTGQDLSELQELAEIFQLVDTDHGGTISREELLQLMKTLGIRPTSDEMDLLMIEIDPNKTGEINFEDDSCINIDFVCTVTKKLQTTTTRADLEHAFKV
jgi:Ca2+-binding EF-hand superfamily protein